MKIYDCMLAGYPNDVPLASPADTLMRLDWLERIYFRKAADLAESLNVRPTYAAVVAATIRKLWPLYPVVSTPAVISASSSS